MNNIEKHRCHVIDQRRVNFETLPESADHSTSNPIMGIFRRWYIVLLTSFVICAIGSPAIWFLIEPLYSVTGAIRVAPILPNILTGEADRGEITNYQNYMYTQAEIITSSRVVQRAADDLADQNLTFFENEHIDLVTKLKYILKGTKISREPASVLKRAISNKVISVEPARRTELIKITMTSTNKQEAAPIVNAFIDAYKDVEVASTSEDEGQKLAVLENERKVLAGKLKSQREKIKSLAQEFGSTTLNSRQEIRLERVGMLLNEVTRWESRRIHLEAQIEVLKNRLEPSDGNAEEQATEHKKLTTEVEVAVDHNGPARRDYINADPTLNAYIENLTLLEQDLIVARQRLAPTNPELKKKADAIKAMKERIEQRKAEVGRMYDSFMAKKIADAEKEKLLKEKNELANLQAELELTQAYEQRFKDLLDEEDTETIDVGRLQLDIDELKDELSLTKETYDKIGRRIEEFKMEIKRPARISVSYYADVASTRDKRLKYSAALVFGSLACGMMLAFLKDKSDQSLRTPDDVAKQIGVRILGTTTSTHAVKRALLPRQLAGDYQTIRANLSLLNGDRMLKKLVVTSPGLREGKTTFSINLATSMSKSGNKVLLIDGDLRKPDIARLLNLPKGSRGLQDVLFGKEFDQAVCSIPSTGLDVLAADYRNQTDAYELIALPVVRQQINKISEKYDHVIIDTPPVLAFPDALVWAKAADAVILISFAGQTTAPDLREATEKLTQINVNVLGIVVNNVGIEHSYYRYGYNYYAQNARSTKNTKRAVAKLLLPTPSQKLNTKDSDS